MNLRIEQLAIQAGVNLSSFQFSGTPIKYEIAESELEKFAELIVRECARYFNEDYVRDFYISWREDLSKGIKDHFGVEE